jgi:two-component system KDP operon response regulator KdpE
MSQSQHIIIVDDEAPAREMVGDYLKMHGFGVTLCDGGKSLRREIETAVPDLVVLDLNMPVLDGLEFCRRIRAWSSVPIIVLSVRDDEPDKIAALDLGADDYLTKPFGTGELLARVRALLRRGEGAPAERPPVYLLDGVAIDMQAHRVTRGNGDVHLTKTEWALLEALTAHPGKLLTHRWLLERVWGDTYGEDVEVLRVFVSQLRRKIEPDPRRPRAIVTEPGIGYRWSEQPIDV